jgi:hypothetical protein
MGFSRRPVSTRPTVAQRPAREFDAYIRVSRKGDREGAAFQSPEEQREKITDWAKLRGVEIVNRNSRTM